MIPQTTVRINHQIKAPEVRLLLESGDVFGVVPLSEALKMAEEAGTDLVEISPNAVPPVARLIDHGKYEYLEKKRQKAQKVKTHVVETKSLQVKIGTGEHDLALKAEKAGEFLKDGHRVKIDLYLRGRAKYMDKKFLNERLQRILTLIPAEYKVSDGPRASPKGLSIIIEKTK